MLNSAFKCLLFTALIFFGHSELSAETRITGSDIKSQALKVLTDDGAQLELLVSDRRTFFPCSTPLNFTPRIQKDWSSVEITCGSEPWSTVLRSTAAQRKNELSVESIAIHKPVVVIVKNISKGEVLNSNHLAYEYPSVSLPGSFTDIENVIGRKAKFNLARGATLKIRQLEINYAVEKGKYVLLTSSNENVSVTVGAIALEQGQIGDIVKVRNERSGTILNVLVTGEKKVSPITNM